jgi:DNA-binding NarL/FixJ family response regulator
VCVGLKAMIDGQLDLSVVAEATSGRRAIEQLRTVPTEALLLDLKLSDVSGIQVPRYVQSRYPMTVEAVKFSFSAHARVAAVQTSWHQGCKTAARSSPA